MNYFHSLQEDFNAASENLVRTAYLLSHLIDDIIGRLGATEKTSIIPYGDERDALLKPSQKPCRFYKHEEGPGVFLKTNMEFDIHQNKGFIASLDIEYHIVLKNGDKMDFFILIADKEAITYSDICNSTIKLFHKKRDQLTRELAEYIRDNTYQLLNIEDKPTSTILKY